MRGHYTPDMGELQLRLFQFEQLMDDTVPLVSKHLRNQGIRSTMYASQWFMTLFAYKFPLDLVFRVFDTILVEGIESILRFSIALLKASHDKILNLDFEVLVEFLKSGLFEYYMVSWLQDRNHLRDDVAPPFIPCNSTHSYSLYNRTTPVCLSRMRPMSR